jgi:hypothetical protein
MARKMKPAQVGTYVMSATHSWLSHRRQETPRIGRLKFPQLIDE